VPVKRATPTERCQSFKRNNIYGEREPRGRPCNNVGGKMQDAVGGLKGDTSTQVRGKLNQAAGSAQNVYGQVADEVKDSATDQPVVALVAAVSVGVILGFFLDRR
jgi:uncharacterized protein YjbJ (UPF0337 family)